MRSSISSTGPHAKPDDKREAGLYHTAFLMPTRADLARWILHVARNKVPLTGASDHAVSEAFYLDDPEGNGIEVYHDRPAESWEWTGDALKITTDPLDIDDILREVPDTASYAGAPGGLRIGHVHLRVGDVGRAETFYRDGLGLDVTRRRHGASFMSSGRYHHHIAGNVWHSAGAGRRDEDRAGLVLVLARSRRRGRLRRGEIPPRPGQRAAHGGADRHRDRRSLGHQAAHRARLILFKLAMRRCRARACARAPRRRASW